MQHIFLLKLFPSRNNCLRANEAFIQKDYRTCVDSLRNVEPSEMEKNTLYILAYSYANMESFRQDEMRNIIDNLSISSNSKILEYWIRIEGWKQKSGRNCPIAV